MPWTPSGRRRAGARRAKAKWRSGGCVHRAVPHGPADPRFDSSAGYLALIAFRPRGRAVQEPVEQRDGDAAPMRCARSQDKARVAEDVPGRGARRRDLVGPLSDGPGSSASRPAGDPGSARASRFGARAGAAQSLKRSRRRRAASGLRGGSGASLATVSRSGGYARARR